MEKDSGICEGINICDTGLLMDFILNINLLPNNFRCMMSGSSECGNIYLIFHIPCSINIYILIVDFL